MRPRSLAIIALSLRWVPSEASRSLTESNGIDQGPEHHGRTTEFFTIQADTKMNLHPSFHAEDSKHMNPGKELNTSVSAAPVHLASIIQLAQDSFQTVVVQTNSSALPRSFIQSVPTNTRAQPRSVVGSFSQAVQTNTSAAPPRSTLLRSAVGSFSQLEDAQESKSQNIVGDMLFSSSDDESAQSEAQNDPDDAEESDTSESEDADGEGEHKKKKHKKEEEGGDEAQDILTRLMSPSPPAKEETVCPEGHKADEKGDCYAGCPENTRHATPDAFGNCECKNGFICFDHSTVVEEERLSKELAPENAERVMKIVKEDQQSHPPGCSAHRDVSEPGVSAIDASTQVSTTFFGHSCLSCKCEKRDTKGGAHAASLLMTALTSTLYVLF